jgi:hypothetical protein
MISYNTHEMQAGKITTKVYEENGSIIVYMEQDNGVCFINFNDEEQFQQFVFELASCFGRFN